MLISHVMTGLHIYMMDADDILECQTDSEDDIYDSDGNDGDPNYDIFKETDLGDPEEQAQHLYEQDKARFERRLVDYEQLAEQAPPLHNNNAETEFVGENIIPHGEGEDGREIQTTTAGGKKAPVKRKGRGPTRAFKKPDTPMYLEYNDRGQPCGKWRHKYGVQLGICVRKIPILLEWPQITPGLLTTFWDDTRVSIQDLKSILAYCTCLHAFVLKCCVLV